MMNFECTENLSVEEEARVISKEILKEYPVINVDKALEMSLLSNTVHKICNEDTMFQRYYVMLEVLDKFSETYNNVYSDMVKVCNGKLKKIINQELYNDLVMFQNRTISEFPCISDYYDEKGSRPKKIENREEYTDIFSNAEYKNDKIDKVDANETNLLPDKVRNNDSIWEKIKRLFKKIFKQ